MTTSDREAAIKQAISMPRSITAPPDLAVSISREIRIVPQEHGRMRLGRFGWLPQPPPAFILGVLLLLGAIGAIAVGLVRPQLKAHLLSEYHGGPDRTGVMVGPGPAGVPTVAWDVTRPGPLPFTTMPLVQDGRVYVVDQSGTAAALDASTGATLWEHRAAGNVRGAPALLDDLLIFGTHDGHVTALRLGDGSQAWDTSIGGAPISASMLEARGQLYVGTEDGTVVSLDGMTGLPAWTVSIGGPVTRGAALADGVVYLGATGGRFSALNAATGLERWHAELGPGEVGTPVVGSGLVYVGRGLLAPEGSHDVVAIEAASGAIRWTFAAPSGRQMFPGALARGVLFSMSEDGSIYALDAATGALVWTTAAASAQLGTLGAIVGNSLYVNSSDRNVQAFDATTGTHLWTVSVVGVPTMSAVVDGSVFIGTSLGHVLAIRDPEAAGTPAGS